MAKLWQEMTWMEIRDMSKECDIVLLPVGATEQHGAHCPTGVDWFNAFEIAKQVSDRTGVVVAPPIAYGSHPYFHYGFVGTLPIRATVQIELIKDIVKGLVNSGFNKIIMVQAHGQWWTMHTALQEIALGVNAFMAVATWWELASATIKRVCQTPFKHADEVETSVSLALYEDLVDMSKAAPDGLTPYVEPKLVRPSVYPDLVEGFPLESITSVPQESCVLNIGSVGDPRLATREKGEAIVGAAVDKIVALVEDLRKRYAPGQVPKVRPTLRVDMY
ncbi:MAG: creatininase family protein [Bacillota bacterium]